MPRRDSFAHDASGLATIEFAFISGVLIFLCLAGFDFGRYVVASQRIEAVSYNIAQMLSQTAVSGSAVDSGDGVIADSTLQWYQNSAPITFPEALSDSFRQGVAWNTLLSVNMTSLRFKPTVAGCTSNCVYTPSVIWSTGNRPCNTTFTQVADTSLASPTTLPTDLYGPNSQLVVDVAYTYQPSFAASWLPTMTISRTTYMSPRNVTMVETTASTIAPICAGVL